MYYTSYPCGTRRPAAGSAVEPASRRSRTTAASRSGLGTRQPGPAHREVPVDRAPPRDLDEPVQHGRDGDAQREEAEVDRDPGGEPQLVVSRSEMHALEG